MGTSTRKPSKRPASAQARAAEKAEALAHLLQSFADSLLSLDVLPKASNRAPTPRNWWRVQAGRFRDDPTFSDFVAGVQAARKHEG